MFTYGHLHYSCIKYIPKEEEGNEIVEIKEIGSIVIQAKFFSKIVKKLPTDTVEIEVQGSRIRAPSSSRMLESI
ncbi:hypothetical protein G4Z05_10805 [Bacillus thermocopriae]|uniref:DNA polymerase III beta sliding clamp N-terminal domain-containing protein n=1 Tax=Neobacillus thermocopriae TaxID=1215031 RepID=A0A6B3TTN6_9BACI|nr:hypothetical protein [Neobacillus thermocopriae]